ncbi:MAG: molybdopterin-dependent oxidoreductase [Dehalococcoidia bacterium]|nr:molybdopterin-dependent oxidoreductase [Dehalococcoidia bacterium]
MADQVKKGVCGLCIQHCFIGVRVRNGEFVGIEPVQIGDSPAAKRATSIVKGCIKNRAAKEFLYHPMRVNYPQKRVGERGQDRWQRITWEQALDEIAEKLKRIADVYGPEAVLFAANAELGTPDEFRGRFQNLFGSPNYVASQHICYGVAQTLALALSGSNIFLSPIQSETRCIMLLATNPAQSNRPLWLQILDARKSGLKLIVIDPRRTESTRIADIWLQPRPGTDAALLLSMMHVIITEGLHNREFVQQYCYGFDQLRERVKDYPPEKVSHITRVPADRIREAARLYATSKPAITWGRALERVPNTVSALHAKLLLPAMTGNLDVRGGDRMNLPHPSAVLSGETALSDKLPQEQKAKMISGKGKFLTWPVYEKIAKNIKRVTPRPASPMWLMAAHPPSVFRAMITGKPYPVKGMITVSHNPLVCNPNTGQIIEAMKKIDLHVAMDIFMTPTCQLADYVLPPASCLERPVLFGGDYWAGLIGGEAALTPRYERKTEYYFWRELGKRLGQDEYWPWETLEEAYDHVVAPLGISFEQFVAKGGVDVPRHEFKKYERLGFGTRTEKFELYSTVLEELGGDPLPSYQDSPQPRFSSAKIASEYPLTLITGGRILQYHHSGSRQLKPCRQKTPDPIAQLNPLTAATLGIGDGDWLWIETPSGRSKHKCRHFEGIASDVVHAQHGWWFPEEPGAEPSLHGLWRSNINVVIDEEHQVPDPVSGSWTTNGIACKVYRAEDQGELIETSDVNRSGKRSDG